jgi:predicted dehydrogenase
LDLVIDPDPAARARARLLAPDAATESAIEALKDSRVDAVVIATPGPFHARHAMVALESGADVFVEKPMTTSLADARSLLSRCRSHGRIGVVGHLLHHHPAVRQMLSLIREGRIGLPLAFRSARLCQRGSRDVDGSLLWSLAPHDVSVLQALDPRPVRQMRVDLRTLGNGSIPNVADLRLRLAGGFEAHVVVSRAHRGKVRRMEVIGEEATVIFDDVTTGPKLALRGGGGLEAVAFDGSQAPLRAEVDSFVRCVCTRTQPEIGFAEGLEVVALLERAQSSAAESRQGPALSAAR